ncbi:MAG: hypothetical protein E1N59_162 [Puniceicoccaceae bacterium 5H]|nr:MAG: hypothetical protein E1N59_162 [Puniceicoccaceae bacterium 5H]
MSQDTPIFAYFTGNGADGLHLAASSDGLNWTPLNDGQPILAPTDGLMRDPYLYRGPRGRFHLIWTTHWDSEDIGYAWSDDLIHWSKQRRLPIMQGIGGVCNCWAPEMVYDPEKDEFLIFWASTVEGTFTETAGETENNYNHRLWCTTTRNFESFSPADIFYNPGFNVIDATHVSGPDGQHCLIIKDETLKPVRKHLFVAEAPRLRGPYGKPGPAISHSWTEGPAVLERDGEITVFFDCYTKGHYGAVRTRDLHRWEDISDLISMPEGARHGSFCRVPDDLLEALKAHYRSA